MISEIRTALEDLGYTVHETRQEKIGTGEQIALRLLLLDCAIVTDPEGQRVAVPHPPLDPVDQAELAAPLI